MVQYEMQQLIEIGLVLEVINNNFFADTLIQELRPRLLR